MPEFDELTQLQTLAREAEHSAEPLPAARVRQLGTRRRHRRRAGLALGALALVILAGGALASGTGAFSMLPPPVAGDPTPTITAEPRRELTQADLVTVAEIPSQPEFQKITEAPPGVGRSTDELSICQPAPLSSLGAGQLLTRNFFVAPVYAPGETPDPNAKNPYLGLPTIYTTALQFGDAAAARQAYQQVATWYADCDGRLEGQGYWVGDQGQQDTPNWFPAPVDAGQAQTSTFGAYRPADDDDDQNGHFEVLGIAVVGDRMFLGVELAYGQDYNNNFDPEQADEMGLDPIFGILDAAATRLDG